MRKLFGVIGLIVFFIGLGMFYLLNSGKVVFSPQKNFVKEPARLENYQGVIPGKSMYLYSSMFAKNTEIITMDHTKLGKKYSISASAGFSKMAQNERGDFWIYSSRTSDVYKIDSNGQVTKDKWTKDKTRGTNFLFLHKDDKLGIFQTEDPDINHIYIKNPNGEFNLKLEGFSQLAAADAHKYYIYSGLMKQQKCVVYVIDRTSGKLTETIQLSGNSVQGAEDIQVINGKLFITTKPTLTIVDLTTRTISNLDEKNLLPKEIYNHVKEATIYISYTDETGKLYIGKYDYSLKKINLESVNSQARRVAFTDEYIYAQSASEKGKVEIAAYSLKDLHEVGRGTMTPNRYNESAIDLGILP
ncbi:hypothetical protein ACFDTO_33685 [Microbacteriaceae bacterium 4G12]